MWYTHPDNVIYLDSAVPRGIISSTRLKKWCHMPIKRSNKSTDKHIFGQWIVIFHPWSRIYMEREIAHHHACRYLSISTMLFIYIPETIWFHSQKPTKSPQIAGHLKCGFETNPGYLEPKRAKAKIDRFQISTALSWIIAKKKNRTTRFPR